MKKNIDAYILAGGKSSRMGQDKGLMLLDNQPIVIKTAQVLQSVFDKVVIVSNQSSYHTLGYGVISDIIQEIGPMGGLYSALHHAQNENVFITACDMPFITDDSIYYLLSHWTEGSIIATINGRLQPLFGIYDKSIIPMIKHSMASNNFKMQDLISKIPHQTLELTTMKGFEAQQLSNLNTMEDYLKAQKSWK